MQTVPFKTKAPTLPIPSVWKDCSVSTVPGLPSGQDLYASKSGDSSVCPISNTYILVPHDATRFHIIIYSYLYARHCQTTIYQHHQDTVAAEQHESDPLVHLGLWFLRKKIPNQSPVAPRQCSCASTKTST